MILSNKYYIGGCKLEFKLNDYHRNVSDENLLDDVKRVADLLGSDILTREAYKKYGKYSSSTIEKRFGSWKLALEKIGISSVRGGVKNINNLNVSNEQLLDDLKNVANRLETTTLTSTQYDESGKHGHNIIISRFQKWETALLMAGLKPTGFHSKISTEDLLEEIECVWVKLGRQPTSSDIKNGVSKYSLNSYVRKFGSWRKALETFVEFINQDIVSEKAEESMPYTTNHKKMDLKTNSVKLETRKTKRDINLRLRFKVMQRDNFKCCICGASPAKDPSIELHIDHIVPWSKGGETTFDNLQTLCSKCNLGKSDLL